MDFQFDKTADGRTLKLFNMVDEFTREALATDVDRAIDADGVVDVLGSPGPPRHRRRRRRRWRDRL